VSDPLADSVWTVFSESGQLGWARVEFHGPNPRQVFGTSPIDVLQAVVTEGADLWFFRWRSKGETRTPGAELDRIEQTTMRVRWLLIVLACLLGTCWDIYHRKRRAARAADPG